MSDDILASIAIDKVHAWYERLGRSSVGNAAAAGVNDPMSGQFLLHYIGRNNNNTLGDVLKRTVPDHLKTSTSVTDVQAFHRRVFLTEEKGNFGPKGGLFGGTVTRWVGLIPRLQKGEWDGKSDIALEYASLSDIAPSLLAINALQKEGNAHKMDIFTSLRGWQLKSKVVVSGVVEADGKVTATFKSWRCSGADVYDFNEGEYLTLPNPDYKSKESFAIAPDKKEIKVYHKNAARMEKASLAKPYNVEITDWVVDDPKLLASAKIDPKKDLT
jgi:hypothetical protein